jgi:hypothetical protein
MDDDRVQLSLAERRAGSVARALRITGRPDSSLEYVDAPARPTVDARPGATAAA